MDRQQAIDAALGIYERVEDMKRDFPDLDLELEKIEPAEEVAKAGAPFHRWILTKSDFLSWKDFFNRTEFCCASCRHRQKIPATWKHYCDEWDCEITPAMEKSRDCPKWSCDFDQDIPY